MNILITDYYCASNRGDASILEGVYQSLQKVYPDADVKVMTEHPLSTQLVHGIDAEDQILASLEEDALKKNVFWAYLSSSTFFQRRGIKPPGFRYIDGRGNLQPYLDADLVVSTGGHFLTDVYFPGKVGVLWEHYFLSRMGTPVVLYAQSLGPFDKQPYRRLVRYVLNRTELIITRDQKSREIVENLGVSTPVEFTADAAFSMELDKARETPLDSFTLDRLPDSEETTVSISVREWEHTSNETEIDDYIQAIADVADWLIEKKGVNIVFASTCTSLAGYPNDDRLIATLIIDQMEHSRTEKVRILGGEYTPQKLVQIYSEMDLHIGMRMHSCILAMLAETPVVAIQYQFKTKGLMETFNMLDYMIDVEDVDFIKLRRTVREAFDKRSELSDEIRAELPTVKDESRRSARIVKEHISGPTH